MFQTVRVDKLGSIQAPDLFRELELKKLAVMEQAGRLQGFFQLESFAASKWLETRQGERAMRIAHRATFDGPGGPQSVSHEVIIEFSA